MSRKQRVLAGLRAVESGFRQAATIGSQETLAAVSQSLTATRDMCRQGLPENSYAKYGEVYDGLILATRQMAERATLSLEEDALALCQELLRYMLQETEKEKSFKKDIFFLPYKASMWDSLESVWKAAYEDKEHCNAYVMPIPYADLNPDRTVAEWHCERGAFPKYVPTLGWQQVDLKEWHPDVIFYHNPYDDCNRVTSVDARYYSGNLKECADKLVYIPYFVLEEPHPGNEAEEESISHFVLNPGVLNADQVIVQSEAMREVYINVLTKNTNQKDRSYWEKRISGAGSPKIDKVLTSKKEDFEMPETWRRLVEGRKVILYNTSLNAMLQNTDKVCDKLRYVFDVFRNRKDVVLWWRPHPLMKSTLHSMRPQFEEEYLRLEKQYIEEGWGIYDDSSDLHRAICWSDAYYGDGSSVVPLYQQTNKPVMIQKLWKQNNPGFMIGYVFVEKKNIFFIGTSGVWQGLFCFDLVDETLHFMDEIPSDRRRFFEYQALGYIDNKIIIAPYFSDKGFLEYDLQKRKFFLRNIGSDVPRKYGAKVAFANVVKHNHSLFFLANQSTAVIEYRADTEEYIVHEEWKGILPDSLPAEDISIGRHCCQVVGNILYFVIAETNILVELNLDTFQGKCYEIPYIKKAWDLHIHKNTLYILPLYNDPFVCLDLNNGDVRQVPNCNEDENVMGWYGMVHLNDRCITIPYRIPKIYGIYDKENKLQEEREIFEDWMGEKDIPAYGTVFYDFVTNPTEDGRCFAYNNYTKWLVEVTQEKNIKIHHLKVKREEWSIIREKIWKYMSKQSEDEVLTIDDFLYCLNHLMQFTNEKEQVQGCGEEIYDSLSKEALA